MNKKVIVAVSSPRKEGYSRYLANVATNHLIKKGIEVEVLNLNKMECTCLRTILPKVFIQWNIAVTH